MDEHGRFYDQVVPPTLDKQSLDRFSSPPPGDTASWVPIFKFDRLGLRVPTIIASPWVPAGKVDSAEYRHTFVLATVIAMFGLRGTLTNRVKTAGTFESLFSEPAARTDTPSSIGTGSTVRSPRTFASSATRDQPNYGLDDMQHEIVQGVDTLIRPQNSEPLPLGNHPDTQAAASDFINARNGREKTTRRRPAVR